MKALTTLLVALFTIEVFANNPNTTSTEETVSSLKPRTFRSLLDDSFDADAYFRSIVLQPTEVNELPNGTMTLSEDLPFVHTLRGTVYTTDQPRYSVR